MRSTSLTHLSHRPGHDWRLLLKVAFWLAATAWVAALVLAPRAAAGVPLQPGSPIVSASEGPRLVWPAPESWRPHFYE